jgi:hypothetical protein
LTAGGVPMGCGTKIEFDKWSDAGDQLGDIIAYEPASEDERRKAAWAKYDAKIAA